MSTDQKTNVPAWPEELKDGSDKKQEYLKIGGLINNLVMYVSLSKSGRKQDADFPGLPVIQAESQKAKNKAIQVMKELLQEWDGSTG